MHTLDCGRVAVCGYWKKWKLEFIFVADSPLDREYVALSCGFHCCSMLELLTEDVHVPHEPMLGYPLSMVVHGFEAQNLDPLLPTLSLEHCYLSVRFPFLILFYFGIQQKKNSQHKKNVHQNRRLSSGFLSFAFNERQISDAFFPSSVAFLINDPNVHDTRTHQWSGFAYTPQWLPMIITYDVHDE